jgi:aquaporin Z
MARKAASKPAKKTAASTRTKKVETKPADKQPAVTASKKPSAASRVTGRIRQFRLRRPERGPLAVGAAIAELLGTFVLALVAVNSGGNALFIAFALIVLVLILAPLSGPHLNPALTIGLWSVKRISTVNALLYVAAQLLGAMLALAVATALLSAPADTTGQTAAPSVYQHPELPTETSALQRSMLNEALGMLVFAFGAASAYLVARGAFARAFVLGGSLYFGLLVFTASPTPVLNPAVAISVGALSWSVWQILIFLLTPIVASIAAMWLYRLLLKDTKNKGSGVVTE